MPTTLDEFTAAMDTFVAAGTTPLCMAGAEYPAGQLSYQLALTKADRSFVDDYQLYKNPVDFQADPLKYGAETFDAVGEEGLHLPGVGVPEGRGHGHRVHRRQVPDDRLR